MNRLELKIPPVAVGVIFIGLLRLIAKLVPQLDLKKHFPPAIALIIAAAGGVFALAGIASFRKANTTVNPLKPETSSSLVTSGVYRVSRNPMYVGLWLGIIGWGVWLSNVAALAVTPLFVVYMNIFQIAPEERALSSAYRDAFTEYKKKVRRWL